MIQRLVTTLTALSRLRANELTADAGRRVADDCADALRLELDCPQQELTADQRTVLIWLGDVLDSRVSEAEVRTAARTACEALGISVDAGGA